EQAATGDGEEPASGEAASAPAVPEGTPRVELHERSDRPLVLGKPNPLPIEPQADPEAAPKQAKRSRMTVEEANQEALRVAARMKSAFFLLSEREQARQIGCHWQTWTKTELYKKAQQKRARLLKQASRADAPGSPPVVSFTSDLEAVTGEGQPNEILDQLIAEEQEATDAKRCWEDLSPAERQQILDEQAADA